MPYENMDGNESIKPPREREIPDEELPAPEMLANFEAAFEHIGAALRNGAQQVALRKWNDADYWYKLWIEVK